MDGRFSRHHVSKSKVRGLHREWHCHTFVKHALEFFEKYTDDLVRDVCEQSSMPWVEDPDDVPFLWEDVLEPSELWEGLRHFLIQNHTSELLESCFARCGMNLRRESDNDIVRRLYGYGKQLHEPTYGYDEVWCILTILHQIDFDLVGLDARPFPLRMLLLEDKPKDHHRVYWFAEVRDRETGALVADAIKLTEGGAFHWSLQTEKMFNGPFFYHGHTSRALHSELTPEQLKSLKASFCRRNSIVYSTHSEFECVISLAANLALV
ncbi:hypothetical protein CBR_g20243 [Chara braunii]|uniref:Uncharacterized protein n=1 Tax=Chara braunii TaxID=69332 RepID=A0A388L088_CHABU|nr:hypothetical protein CBR_g20243 [Chara braunii]|eukprot:GBG75613.1 hypothetical protein CBR_g20243 [Chara braunii]